MESRKSVSDKVRGPLKQKHESTVKWLDLHFYSSVSCCNETQIGREKGSTDPLGGASKSSNEKAAGTEVMGETGCDVRHCGNQLWNQQVPGLTESSGYS